MNARPSIELKNAFSRLDTALAQRGRRRKKTQDVESKKAVDEFRDQIGTVIPGEYLDAMLLENFAASSGEPIFRGLPLVSPRNAVDIFLVSDSPNSLFLEYPFLSFCESDGAGLFVNLGQTHDYDAPLSYVAPGVESFVQFRNIRSFLNAISECLEMGMSDILLKSAYGAERKRQDVLLEKYR